MNVINASEVRKLDILAAEIDFPINISSNNFAVL